MQCKIFMDKIRFTGELPAGSYLNGIPAVRWLRDNKELCFDSPVTILCGENGAGKSTLIEAIAIKCGFNPEGGTKNYCFSTSDTHSPLHAALTVSRLARERDGYFLRAESFYNASTYLEELDKIKCPLPPVLDSYGGASLHTRSHGEAFMALMENRFGGNGLYVLDEPEAALSPMRILRMLVRIHELVERGSQFIIFTHSPIVMAYPGAVIYELSQKGIEKTHWRATEHYAVTKWVLDDDNAVEKLLNESENDK